MEKARAAREGAAGGKGEVALMELGGNDPALETGDLDTIEGGPPEIRQAVRQAIAGRFVPSWEWRRRDQVRYAGAGEPQVSGRKVCGHGNS